MHTRRDPFESVSLIARLHQAHRDFRRLRQAVEDQPEALRLDILERYTRMREE